MPAGRAGCGWEGLSRLGTILAGVGLSRADAAGQSTSCPPWAKPGAGGGAGHAAPGGGAADGRAGCGQGCALPVTTKLVGGRPSRARTGVPTEGPTSCNEGAAEPGAPCTTGKQLARRGPSRVARGSHRRGPGSATVCEPGARQQGAARGGLGEVAEGAAPPRRRWCRPWRPGRGQLRPRAVVSRRGGGPVRLVPYRRYSHARPRGGAGWRALSRRGRGTVCSTVWRNWSMLRAWSSCIDAMVSRAWRSNAHAEAGVRP